MRDGLMAALILDAVGHASEARQFLEWVPQAPLTDTGGFHTCYNTFTGDVEGFVEPQYDSATLYVIALLYDYRTTRDAAWAIGQKNPSKIETAS
jgi:GH15 family glucan-1,4-alpha-glucosidase